jgi:hypothetical protein
VTRKPRWQTRTWLSAIQLGLRYGLPPKDVDALVSAGRQAGQLPRRGAKTSKLVTVYDAAAFGQLPGLEERQKSKAARYFQWENKLYHILPTAWDKVADDYFLDSPEQAGV